MNFLTRIRWARVGVVRAAEKHLPGPLFRAALFPMIFARSARYWRNDRKTYQMLRRLPDSFHRPTSACATFKARYRVELSRMIRLWPERLREPRWQTRCRIFGEDLLRTSLASKRPVILATVHYGGLLELFHWIRSKSLPLAAMAIHHRVEDALQIYLESLADRANGLVDAPKRFGIEAEELFKTRHFLCEGALLMVAIDPPTGSRTSKVKLDDLTITVQLGVFTLAVISNAIVIPALLRLGTGMTYELHFRPPVPDELVADRSHHADAAQHVLRELMPLVRECPEQADPPLLSGKSEGRDTGESLT